MQSEIKYILSLAKKHTNEIGFVPQPRIEADYKKNRFLIERENNELCGFLYFGNGRRNLVIYQACIQYDAQRKAHGFALVSRIIKYADKNNFQTISCTCADDLEANSFWKVCGFAWSGRTEIPSKRGRFKNKWIFYLPDPKQRNLFL